MNTTTRTARALVTLAVLLATLMGVLLTSQSASASQTSARTSGVRCIGTTYSGKCYYYQSAVRNSVTIEAVPFVNRSNISVRANCAFTKSVSYTLTGTISLSYEAKASLFGLVGEKVGGTLQMALSQSYSQASTAAASFTVAPGRTVTCFRTYSYVRATVKEVTYVGSNTTARIFTTTIPSTLGITVQ
jgi:hypothetical protein